MPTWLVGNTNTPPPTSYAAALLSALRLGDDTCGRIKPMPPTRYGRTGPTPTPTSRLLIAENTELLALGVSPKKFCA